MSSTKTNKSEQAKPGAKAKAVPSAKASPSKSIKPTMKAAPKAPAAKFAQPLKARLPKTATQPKPKASEKTVLKSATKPGKAPAGTKSKSKFVPAPAVKTEAPRSQVRAAQQKPDKKLTARARSAPILLTPDYRPSENEPFMSEMHRAYFRQKLSNWKDEIIRQTKETLVILHEDSVQHADIADRATSETDRSLELRARDRQRKLISKIDAALARLDDGSYGYCEETGEPIGLKRLDARPIATLSLEAQERHERREKVYRED